MKYWMSVIFKHLLAEIYTRLHTVVVNASDMTWNSRRTKGQTFKIDF